MTWEASIRWCYVHETSAVEDLDYCWKVQWYRDNGELMWRRCQILDGRLLIDSFSASKTQVGEPE